MKQNHHVVLFSAEIIPYTVEALLAVMTNILQQGGPVRQEVDLLITTPGGSVMHGMHLYNVLRAMPFDLTTHNVGAVNSIGNVIFLAGEKRYACESSSFMFHGVGFDVNQTMRLEEKFLRERLDGIVADQVKIGGVIAERTRLNSEEVKQLFLEANTRGPRYALDAGIVHEVREASIPLGTPVTQLVFQR